jgi:zinc ribbon protein
MRRNRLPKNSERQRHFRKGKWLWEIIMHCPTCGTIASTDQKFCRSCGTGLSVISQLVAKHLSATDPALLPAESDASKPRRRTTVLFSGIVSCIIGLALLVANKQDDWIGAVGILLLVAGTLTAAYGVLSPRWQIKRSPRTPLPQPAILPPAESTGLASAKAHDQAHVEK